jgi:hypothetical protein
VAEPPAWKDKHAADLFAYERLLARSLQSNAMQWQAPSLALAAQAFLLTLGLRDEITRRQKAAVCFVGILITAMAWQLMARHRYYFHLDQAEMRRLEARIARLEKGTGLALPPMADRTKQAQRHANVIPAVGAGKASFFFWRAGFVLIALVDVAILASAWWRFTSFWPKFALVGVTVALLLWGGGEGWRRHRRRQAAKAASSDAPEDTGDM